MVVSLVFVINSLVSLFSRLSWKATVLSPLSNKVALFIYLCTTQHNFLVCCYHISMFVYYLFLNMVVLVSSQICLSVFFFPFSFISGFIYFFHWIRLSPCVNTFVDYFWASRFYLCIFFFVFPIQTILFCWNFFIYFLNSVFNFPCNYLFCSSFISAFFCLI